MRLIIFQDALAIIAGIDGDCEYSGKDDSGDYYYYDLSEEGVEIVKYKIVPWIHDDGVTTYTLYDNKGNYIKDIAIVPFDNYDIVKLKD